LQPIGRPASIGHGGPADRLHQGIRQMTATPRRCYEPGHRPKFLVVVDETPECDRAVYFAARRAGRVGADVVLLAIAEPGDFEQWLGVSDVIKAEAAEEARERAEAAADRIRSVAGVEPEIVVHEGVPSEEIVALIEADEDISLLILAAGTGNDGPGPLVSSLAGKSAGSFAVPIAIVPGHLSDRDIDTLS
jgi:nucleotide-binding universal stress UspA family protein